jgi:hypothetical protein
MTGLLVQAQDLQNDKSIENDQLFFNSESPISCTLTFDIREFMRVKMEEEKLPALFSCLNHDSLVIADSILVSSRGNSRKKFCDFPPIKLSLKNSNFEDPCLNQVNKLKLVTHCDSYKGYEEYMHREYLVYKLYNLITDKSFRVQLIKVDYVDAAQKVETISRYAFLIEDVDMLAARNDCVEIENENLGMRHVQQASMMQFSLFQFMIGNVDWKMEGLHNIKLIKSSDFMQELPFVVPYDFDHSGFVNASYATNVRDPEISSVKRRVFSGLCLSEAEYLEALEIFVETKPEMYEIINSFQPLTLRTKKEIIKYLDQFYKLIDKPKFYKRYILPNCYSKN